MVGSVLQHVGVGEQQECDLAHPIIDRGSRARATQPAAEQPPVWTCSQKPTSRPSTSAVVCAQNGLAAPVPVSPAITKPSISFFVDAGLVEQLFEESRRTAPRRRGRSSPSPWFRRRPQSRCHANSLSTPLIVAWHALEMLYPAARAVRSCRGTGAAARSIRGCGCIPPPCVRRTSRRRRTCPGGAAGCW